MPSLPPVSSTPPNVSGIVFDSKGRISQYVEGNATYVVTYDLQGRIASVLKA